MQDFVFTIFDWSNYNRIKIKNPLLIDWKEIESLSKLALWSIKTVEIQIKCLLWVVSSHRDLNKCSTHYKLDDYYIVMEFVNLKPNT